jgi:lysophospholipase L1-like esterase
VLRLLALLLIAAIAFGAGVMLQPSADLMREHAASIRVEEPAPEPEEIAPPPQNGLLAVFSPTRRIAFVGDSLIEEADLSDLLDDYEVSNCGAPCDTSTSILAWLAQAVPKRGGVFVLQMGIDELKHGTSPATVVENARSIVQHLVWDKRARVILLPILETGGDDRRLHARIRECNEGLRNIGAAAGVLWLDVNQQLSPGGTLARQYTADGVRLNATGYRRWSDALRPVLHAALNEWR